MNQTIAVRSDTSICEEELNQLKEDFEEIAKSKGYDHTIPIINEIETYCEHNLLDFNEVMIYLFKEELEECILYFGQIPDNTGLAYGVKLFRRWLEE